MYRNPIFRFLIVALLAVFVPVSALAEEPADSVALGGKIYTSNDAQPWATAVAVLFAITALFAAFADGLRKSLFPELGALFGAFLEDGDWEAVEKGRKK